MVSGVRQAAKLSCPAEKEHRQQGASKRLGIQHELEGQIAEVKARHKQEAAEEVATAKKAEDDVAKWKSEEAGKETLKKEAMLKLKASATPTLHELLFLFLGKTIGADSDCNLALLAASTTKVWVCMIRPLWRVS